MNFAIKKVMKAARENWTESQCRHIDDGMAQGDIKKAYSLVKTFTKADQHKTSVIEDSNDRLLTKSRAVLNRWTESCKDFQNFQLKTDANIL